jgi:hypothetical protein
MWVGSLFLTWSETLVLIQIMHSTIALGLCGKMSHTCVHELQIRSFRTTGSKSRRLHQELRQPAEEFEVWCSLDMCSVNFKI